MTAVARRSPQRQVVLRGAALVAMPFDQKLRPGIFLQEGGHGLARLAAVLFQLRLVEVEPDVVELRSPLLGKRDSGRPSRGVRLSREPAPLSRALPLTPEGVPAEGAWAPSVSPSASWRIPPTSMRQWTMPLRPISMYVYPSFSFPPVI